MLHTLQHCFTFRKENQATDKICGSYGFKTKTALKKILNFYNNSLRIIFFYAFQIEVKRTAFADYRTYANFALVLFYHSPTQR